MTTKEEYIKKAKNETDIERLAFIGINAALDQSLNMEEVMEVANTVVDRRNELLGTEDKDYE